MDKKEQSRVGKSNVRRGKCHERKIAACLTEWSNIKFVRRKIEGKDEFITKRNSSADVICASKHFKFSVEVKCGAGFSHDALIMNPDTNKFSQWWSQAVYDAGITSRALGLEVLPMLFFKPKPNTNWVAITRTALQHFEFKEKLRYLSYDYPDVEYTFDISHSKKHKNLVSLILPGIIMCPWSIFASSVVPSEKLFFDI